MCRIAQQPNLGIVSFSEDLGSALEAICFPVWGKKKKKHQHAHTHAQAESIVLDVLSCPCWLRLAESTTRWITITSRQILDALLLRFHLTNAGNPCLYSFPGKLTQEFPLGESTRVLVVKLPARIFFGAIIRLVSSFCPCPTSLSFCKQKHYT